MTASAKSLLREALQLPSNDRAALVEGLIFSLDQPDPSLDDRWLKEAEDRLAPLRHVLEVLRLRHGADARGVDGNGARGARARGQHQPERPTTGTQMGSWFVPRRRLDVRSRSLLRSSFSSFSR